MLVARIQQHQPLCVLHDTRPRPMQVPHSYPARKASHFRICPSPWATRNCRITRPHFPKHPLPAANKGKRGQVALSSRHTPIGDPTHPVPSPGAALPHEATPPCRRRGRHVSSPPSRACCWRARACLLVRHVCIPCACRGRSVEGIGWTPRGGRRGPGVALGGWQSARSSSIGREA